MKSMLRCGGGVLVLAWVVACSSSEGGVEPSPMDVLSENPTTGDDLTGQEPGSGGQDAVADGTGGGSQNSSGGAAQGSGGTAAGGQVSTGGSGAMSSSGGASGSGGESSGAGGTIGGEPACDNSYPIMTCDSLGTWPDGQSAEEDAVLALVNQYRASGATCGTEAMPAVSPLTMDETLRCAARLHSQDMAARSYFSHATWNPDACTCSDNKDCGSGYICDNKSGDEAPLRCGKGPGLRVSEIGGPSGAGWENIAAGNSTAEQTMSQWMKSAGHCRNIMNGSLKTIGIGYAKGGPYGHYWTQAFDN